MYMKLKKGDNVIVITGKHKGQKGAITEINKVTNRVIVGGVNKVKHHIKAKKTKEKGSIVEKEASIALSNVMLADPKTGKPTRIGSKMVGDKKVRIAKKSNQEIK